jgi:hypothetical protein
MNTRVTPSERIQAGRFAEWFSAQTGTQHSIIDGPNPPDFLLQSDSHQTWLEVTDIYLSNEQAKFFNSPTSQTYKFEGYPDELATRFINQLNRKLSNNSYRPIFEERGKGLLLLTCEDFMFDDVNLARVEECLECLPSWFPLDNQGLFSTAYFEYCLRGAGPFY